MDERSNDTGQAVGVMHDRVTNHCFHCSEPIPKGVTILAKLADGYEAVCCIGCKAVAELIAGAGLSDYYRYRDQPGQRPDSERDRGLSAYDRSEALAQFTEFKDGLRSTSLALDGLGCAACAWLIERMLRREPGIDRVHVNVASGRAWVRWNPDRIVLSEILKHLVTLGFEPHILDKASWSERAKLERRASLKRLAVAGFGMMQVMMFAVAMYATDLSRETMDPNILAYFRYISLLCATPVLFYSGEPFLINAWRAFRARTVTMDVTVSVALVLAYVASLVNTARGSGEVYFDSVTMFVFFLSLSRFVEAIARRQSGELTDALAKLIPVTAHREVGGTVEAALVSSISVGDTLIVRVGETLPADGMIIEGATRIDESMLTGESRPIRRDRGSEVRAGTLNIGAPIRIQVTAHGSSTVLSGIVRLLEHAERERSPQIEIADRVASWVLGRILIGAALVAAGWLIADPSRAFATTLSVLVVTCPCALSLAMPTALAAATRALARRGVLVVRSSAIDQLAKVERVAFDKTGTLTHGRPTIERCRTKGELPEHRCRDLAAALEASSEHPLASAFTADRRVPTAIDTVVFPGRGVEGMIDGRKYRIGRRDFALELSGTVLEEEAGDSANIFLGDIHGCLAEFQVCDAIRSEAAAVIARLRALGIRSEIISGDSWVAVAHAARACGIEEFAARQSPDEKLQALRESLARNEHLAMIGDGINDAPVLRAAPVSIAMGRGSALAQVSADIVLTADSLAAVPNAIAVARRAQRIIKQNLAWAAIYNFAALPLAALGFVPPWAAAVGMSMSSSIVVLNALRISRIGRRNSSVAEDGIACSESAWSVDASRVANGARMEA